jgi:cytoskeletal protein CcmA (bactofilin family)
MFSIFGRQFGRKRRRAVDRIEFTTLIGSGAHYAGDVRGNENYVVCGSVDGNCDVEGHVVLAAGSRWRGDVRATYVVIAGEVHGDVHAAEKLELQESARITGNITAPVIAMAEGAIYDGGIHMRPRPQVMRFNEKRSI